MGAPRARDNAHGGLVQSPWLDLSHARQSDSGFFTLFQCRRFKSVPEGRQAVGISIPLCSSINSSFPHHSASLLPLFFNTFPGLCWGQSHSLSLSFCLNLS